MDNTRDTRIILFIFKDDKPNIFTDELTTGLIYYVIHFEDFYRFVNDRGQLDWFSKTSSFEKENVEWIHEE